jgi:hypothetical protein
MTLPAKRGSHGHFLPGVSGNPGGRTSALTEVRELLRPNAPKFVARLLELAGDSDPKIALQALELAFDRLLGKPVAVVESDVRTLNVNEAIQQLYLQAVRAGGPTIEAEPGPTRIVNGMSVPIKDGDQ